MSNTTVRSGPEVFPDATPRARPAPGPRGHRLLGNLLDIKRDRLRFVSRATSAWGDLVAFRMGPRKLYLLNHPDHFRHVLCDHPERYAKGLGLREAQPLLGQGLLTSEGDLWAAQRSLLKRAFHRRRLEEFGRSMSAAAVHADLRWEKAARAGHPIDVAAEMVRLTLEVLAETLLPGDWVSHGDRITADLNTAARASMRRMIALVRLPLEFPTPTNAAFRRAVARLEAWASELLARHTGTDAADGRAEDLVSLMLAPPDGQPPVSKRQIRDEILTFLLAGHETTAATLSWAWYLLAHHPAAAARLRHEIDRVLGERPPALEDLPALVYTRRVLEEAVRLYPPVWLIPRKALSDDVIGGYGIPSGADVLLCVYTLHRHRAFWEEPERFEPERFSTDGDRQRHPHCYLPFGSGARACLGSRFGLLEATLVLATLARRYRLEAVAGREPVPEASLVLKPRDGLWMRPVLRGTGPRTR